MKIIVNLLKSESLILLTSILLGIISGICSTLLIIIIGQPDHINYFHIHSSLLYSFLLLIVATSSLGSNILILKLSQKSIYKLRKFLCNKISEISLANFEKIGKPKFYSILTQDIHNLIGAFSVLPGVLINIIIILSGLAYLGQFSAFLFTIVCLLMLTSVIFFYAVNKKYIATNFEKARTLVDQLFESVQTLLDGAKELRLNNTLKKDYFNCEFEQTSQGLKEHHTAAVRTFYIAGTMWQCSLYLLLGLFVFIPAIMTMVEHTHIGQYLAILIFLISPLTWLMNVLPLLIQSYISIKKIHHLNLDINHTSINMSNYLEQPLAEKLHTLELQHIEYVFNGNSNSSNFHLGPIDLIFQPGITFIIGDNGSGKSTLSKIMTGLYLPCKGHILFNKQLINSSNINWYQQHFSAVFSDFYLFNKIAVPENIDMHELLKKFELDKVIFYPNNDAQEITFNPSTLSDGQKKRIALLNIFCEDKPIIILDEWATYQDPKFRDKFYCELLYELKEKDKCIIAISHDEQYFHIADHIIELKQGHLEKK